MNNKEEIPLKRNDFIRIIKLRSFWRIDRRKGNYELPSGEKLSAYVRSLVDGQLELDKLAIADDGNLCPATLICGNGKAEYLLIPPCRNNESCSWSEQERRIERLVLEIIM